MVSLLAAVTTEMINNKKPFIGDDVDNLLGIRGGWLSIYIATNFWCFDFVYIPN